MPFTVHEQHVDISLGMHVIEIRDGKSSEIVQIALRNHSCPACGVLYSKTELGEIDPKAMVAALIEERNASQDAMREYAKKHGLKVI
jgi:hypothetical protein